jgi:hypothetical protein
MRLESHVPPKRLYPTTKLHSAKPRMSQTENPCVKIGELIHKYYNMSISVLLHLEYSFVIVLKFGNSEDTADNL